MIVKCKYVNSSSNKTYKIGLHLFLLIKVISKMSCCGWLLCPLWLILLLTLAFPIALIMSPIYVFVAFLNALCCEKCLVSSKLILSFYFCKLK